MKVLAVDDNEDSLFSLKLLLEKNGFECVTTSDPDRAIPLIAAENPNVILLDVMMPRQSGFELTKKLKKDPELRYIPVILLTARSGLEDIVEGLENGADGYVTKPFASEELIARVKAALRTATIYSELKNSNTSNERMLEEISSPYNFQKIVARSPAMKGVIELVKKVVRVDSPVLITGPSGTGKELIARAIHYNSDRKKKPFVAVNCAALNENLLESELFGYVKGSFTGAVKDKIGLFQAAHGGTLFLDEVGEMSALLQAKLLRVLQEGNFIQVGGTTQTEVDVRIIAATNRDLKSMSEKGTFREDLYYRLNVISIVIPPLHERKEDIMPIVESFLNKLSAKRNVQAKQLTPEVENLFLEYRWRGNVRELENEVERMLILGQDDDVLGKELVSSHIRSSDASGGDSTGAALTSSSSLNLKLAVKRLEKLYISEAIKRFEGNKSRAADELGISRSSLISKVKEYGLG